MKKTYSVYISFEYDDQDSDMIGFVKRLKNYILPLKKEVDEHTSLPPGQPGRYQWFLRETDVEEKHND